MKRFFILPEYADEPWGEADTIEEAIKWAYDKRKAKYDTYDDALKDSVDKCFDCI